MIASKKNSIASELNGKIVERTPMYVLDGSTLVCTFEDGSQAFMITKWIDCEPYLSASLSTMSKRPVKYWQVV